MRRNRINRRKWLVVSVACALVGALSLSDIDMMASAQELSDSTHDQQVVAQRDSSEAEPSLSLEEGKPVPGVEGVPTDVTPLEDASVDGVLAGKDVDSQTADDVLGPEEFDLSDALPVDFNDLSTAFSGVRDGLWIVDGHGSVRNIKTFPDGTRKVVSHDFPLGKFCWKSANGHSPEDYVQDEQGNRAVPYFERVANDGKFDGLAQNDTYLYLTATRGHENGGNNGGATVVRLIKETGQWQYNAGGTWTNIQWEDSTNNAGQKVSLYEVPKFDPPAPVGSCVKPNKKLEFNVNSANNTFSQFQGNVTSGALLPDGTYVFGDITKMPSPRDTPITKYFALKENGEVLYLGHTKIKQASPQFSLHGNFVLSEDGDLYAGYGGTNSVNETITLSVNKISARDLQNLINNPQAKFDTGRNRWVYPGTTRVYNQSVVPSGPDLPYSRVVDGKVIPVGFRATTFAGFDVSPEGNLALGLEGSPSHVLNGIPQQVDGSYVVEIDMNTGQYIQTVKPYVAVENPDNPNPAKRKSAKLAWLNGYGSVFVEFTDFQGFLGPVAPPEPRELTLYKEVVNKRPNDTFTVDLNPLGDNSNNPKYTLVAQNTGELTAEAGAPNKFKIGHLKELPNGDFSARIGERGGYRTKLADYTTTLTCTEGITVSEQHNSAGSGKRFYDITIPGKQNGLMECTLRNELPLKLTVKHVLNGRYLEADQFSTSVTGAGITNGTHVTKPSDQPGEFIVVQNAVATKNSDYTFNKQFLEGASADNYTHDFVCTSGGEQIAPNPGFDLATGGVVHFSENLNADVECVFTTTPKAKGYVLINKFSEVNNAPLGGSQWKVLKENTAGKFETYKQLLVDNNTETTADAQDEDTVAGKIKLTLPVGKYRVVETAAPAGFSILQDNEQPGEFELTHKVPSKEINITNKRAEVPVLPLTGGLGVLPYMLVGLFVLFGAISVTAFSSNMRRTQTSNNPKITE